MVPTPARLHVLLARDAPVGVVLRRGPSKQVATFLWDRRSDQFTVGQWFEGRIYERRSDLSPDGRHLIYFAMNGRWHAEAKGAWTAISRAPHLKALALFPKGDCWFGGGLWMENGRYWLNGGGLTPLVQTTEARPADDYRPPASYGGECPGVYYVRLQRDGWTYLGRTVRGKRDAIDTFERPLAFGWTLRKVAHAQVGSADGKGCYWDEHGLVKPGGDGAIALPGWGWADVDGNRLVWAVDGILYAGRLTPDGLADPRPLFDFNPMKFEPIPAPY